MAQMTPEQLKTIIKNGNASYENKTKALEYIDELLLDSYAGNIDYKRILTDNHTLSNKVNQLELQASAYRLMSNTKVGALGSINKQEPIKFNTESCITSLTNKCNEQELEIAKLHNYIAAQDTVITNLKNRIIYDETVIKDFTDKVASLTKTNDMDKILSRSDIIKESYVNHINTLTNEVIHWKDTYMKVDNENDTLRIEITKLKEQLVTSNTHTEYSSLVNQVNILNDKLTKVTKERDDLALQISCFIDDKVTGKTKAYTLLFNEVDALKQQLSDVVITRDNWMNKYNKLAAIISALSGIGIVIKETE